MGQAAIDHQKPLLLFQHSWYWEVDTNLGTVVFFLAWSGGAMLWLVLANGLEIKRYGIAQLQENEKWRLYSPSLFLLVSKWGRLQEEQVSPSNDSHPPELYYRSEELFYTVFMFCYEIWVRILYCDTATQRLKTGTEDPLPSLKNWQREHLHRPCQVLQEIHYIIKYFDPLICSNEYQD